MTDDEERRALAARIRAARRQAGRTQQDVADHLGTARSAVAAIEACARRITALELGRLARFLGTDVGALIGEDPPGPRAVRLHDALTRLTPEDRRSALVYAVFLVWKRTTRPRTVPANPLGPPSPRRHHL